MTKLEIVLCVLRRDVVSHQWRAYLDNPVGSVHLGGKHFVSEGKSFPTPDEAYDALQAEVWAETRAHVLYPLGPDAIGLMWSEQELS